MATKKQPATTTTTNAATAHPITLVRGRLTQAGLERLLLLPLLDLVPRLFRHSRRGARLAERLVADRPLLSTSSALAELAGQVQDPERQRAWSPARSPVAAGIPRVLVDKLAYALHRFIDEAAATRGGPGAPRWTFAFGDAVVPGPVAPELRGTLLALERLRDDLRRKLGKSGDPSDVDGSNAGSGLMGGRRRARVTLDEGPPPGFFFTEDTAAVPRGMLLSLDDVDAVDAGTGGGTGGGTGVDTGGRPEKRLGFVGVRGPLPDLDTQLYAVERVLDVVLEPMFDEGPRLVRLAGGRYGALLAALDELVVVDPLDGAGEARLCWKVVHKSGGLALQPVVRGRSGPGPGAGYQGPRDGVELDDKLTGKRLEDAVRTLPFATPQDQEIVRIYLARHERLDGVVADKLVDHPGLELADGRPLKALHANPVVVVKEDHTLGFTALGRPLDCQALGDDGAAIVVDGDHARLLAVPITPAQRELARALARIGDQPLPPGVLDDVVKRLKKGKLEVQLPVSLRGRQREPEPTLVVRVAWKARGTGAVVLGHGGARFSLVARPLVGGATFVPGAGPPVAFASDEKGDAVWCQRDLPGESARADELMRAVDVDDDAAEGAYAFAFLSPERALRTLTDLAERDDVVLAFTADGPRVSSVRARQLQVRLGKRTDWLGLDGAVELDDGTPLELQPLIEALREGRRWVVVDKNHIAALSAELADQLGPLAAFSSSKGALAAGSVAVVDEAAAVLAEAGAHVERDAGWTLARDATDRARDVDGIPPPGIRATLRPYQQDGLRFLRRLACWGTGGVLADDMGLGKTLVTMCLLADRGRDGPALVVAPTSLCFHWAAELARFAPMLNPIVYGDAPARGHGADRAALVDSAGPNDVVIASYGLLQRDVDRVFAKKAFTTLVVDEAQAVKNATTARAQALRRLPSGFRVALTGTPIENHTSELWSIFDLVSPGLFGTFNQWKARWASPIEKDDDVKRRQLLARTIRPFLLRRKKSEVAKDLPAKTVVTRVLPLSADERQSYERLRLALVADLERDEDRGERELDAAEKRVQILAALTRLRLCACHPVFAADVVDPAAVAAGSKQKALVELVDELRDAGHKTLVFSQFVRHLTLARRFLDESGAKTLMLTGDTPARQRQALVEQFQAGDADVFLISLKAGGFGLNLTRASYVVHLDPWWNPAVEEQASDRAHRIGQTLPVTVVRLVAGGTLEEPILELHERKRALADGVLDGTDVAGTLSLDELMGLVKTSRRFDGAAGQELAGPALDDTAD